MEKIYCSLVSINKLICYQGHWALGYHSIKFRRFPDISQFAKILSLWHLVRQLVYTMFISNNCASIHLWWKEKFSKTTQSLEILYNWLWAATTALVQTTSNQLASQPNAPISTRTNQNWFLLNISKYYVMNIFKGASFEKKFW